MSKKREVASFLKDFKIKMNLWDVMFRDDRGKNAQTLAELEIRPIDRIDILSKLEAKDLLRQTKWLSGVLST